ncbi:MAG: carbohydrate-binding family 9-like protein [Oscillospiraceae bacterium]|nr:carbohydrate-binding family 9-like protein [Oscillospiraceae bacterium]
MSPSSWTRLPQSCCPCKSVKTYTVAPVCGAPDWDAIDVIDVSEVLWLPDCGIRMQQQLCYDAQYLYVHQRAWETNIRAELTGNLQQVSEDSCMEFFFSPLGDGRYFNVEINPNGCMRLGYHGTDMTLLLTPKDMADFAITPQRTEDGWQLEYRIPFSFIRIFFPDFRAESGAEMRANFYKCGDKTATPHYLAWNPIDSPAPAFHRPQDFGRLIFG